MNLKENFKGMWIMALAFAVIFGVVYRHIFYGKRRGTAAD